MGAHAPKTVNPQPIIESFEAWLHNDGQQRSMWPGVLELSERFYESLQEHAVPLHPGDLKHLKQSALALDIYTWLAHRLYRIPAGPGVRVHWKSLRAQFGQEYKNDKDFKKEFRRALALVTSTYLDANIEDVTGGLLLKHSRPPVTQTRVQVQLPDRK
jgi:hypothetical protein